MPEEWDLQLRTGAHSSSRFSTVDTTWAAYDRGWQLVILFTHSRIKLAAPLIPSPGKR